MASDLRPALAGSAALHLALLAATLIAWPHFAKPLPTGPVAVKLVARAPVTDVRPAVETPEPLPATAPEPAPEQQEIAPAPPPPVPPPPVPPPPKPPPPKPPTPEPKPQSLDLDKLASKLPKPKLDLNRLAKSQPQPKLNLNALAARPQAKLDLNKLAGRGAKGPLRPEQATQARQAAGAAQGLTADEASLLADKLNRLWNPNCGVEGAGNIQVRVDIRLTQTGALAAPPALVGPRSNDPVWQAAAQRALSAVARGAPYDELPRDRYTVWKDIVFNFNGRSACGRG